MPRPGCRFRLSRERTAASGIFSPDRPGEAGGHRGTRDGRRFTNESQNYHDFVRAMIEALCRARGCLGLRDLRPSNRQALRAWRCPSFAVADLALRPLRISQDGPHRSELGLSAGIDPENLEQPSSRSTAMPGRGATVRSGGETSYQRLLGDDGVAPVPVSAKSRSRRSTP